MSNNDDISLKISAAVEGDKEIAKLEKQLENFGANSSEISDEISDLVKEINRINEASKLIDQLTVANNNLSESSNVLEEAKNKYDELANSVEEFKESNDVESLRNAELALKAQEREVLRLTTANNRAVLAQEALNSRIDASNVADLVRDEEDLVRVIDSAASAQNSLNQVLTETIQYNSDRRLLNVDGAREQQAQIDELRAAYERLASSGELSADELRIAHQNMSDSINNIEGGLDGVNRTSDTTVTAFKKMAAAAISFSVIAGLFKKSIDEAIKFESAMAQVSKSMDASKADIDRLGNSLKELSRTIPMSAAGLAEISAAGASLQLPIDEIVQFTEIVAKMSTAFDIGAEEAGKSAAELMSALGLKIYQLEDLSDAINHISNNSNAAAAGIIDVMARIGSSAKAFGLSAEQAAALGSALLSMGKTSEVAGTAINKMLLVLGNAKNGTAEFKEGLEKIGMSAVEMSQAIKENPQKALETFFETISKLDGQDQADILSKMFGAQQQANISAFIGGLKTTQKQFGLVGDKAKYAKSMQKEFEIQSNTTENRLNLLKNALTEIGINLGNEFLPLIGDATEAVRDWSASLDGVGPKAKDVFNFASMELTNLETSIYGAVDAYSRLFSGDFKGFQESFSITSAIVEDNTDKYIDNAAAASKAAQVKPLTAAQREVQKELQRTTDKLAAATEKYKDVAEKAGIYSETGGIKAEVIASIERTNEYLERLGLSYKSVVQGMTVEGEKVISSIRGLRDEASATSDVITASLVAALEQIQTPTELEALYSEFAILRANTKITGEDLALLSPVFADINNKITEGLEPGAAFDEALNKWSTSASNAAKGIKELTVEQETLNDQLAKEIDLINLTISSEIKKLKAKQDLARALGDVNGEAALGNEIAKLEVKLGSDVAAITAKKLALDKQVLAGLQAKIASGQKLTASELAQKEALEKAIIENETAIAVYKISIETKQAEALASGQVIAGNEGIATSAASAASATSGLSNEMSGLADTASSAKAEVDKATESFSSGNIAGSAKNWALINEQTRKELQDTAKYWNHLTSYQRAVKKKEIQDQVDKYDELMQRMSDVKEMSAEEAEHMLAAFKRLNLLDQQQMASMKSQLYDIVQRSKEAKEAVSNEVQARIKAIADEATGAVNGALKKLDELNSRSKDQNESKANEMEAKAAQATAEGNQEAAAKFLEAAQLFDEIARKEKANERIKQQQAAANAYMSKKEPEVLGYYEIKVEAGNKVMTLPAPTKEFVKQFFDVIEQVKRTSM